MILFFKNLLFQSLDSYKIKRIRFLNKTQSDHYTKCYDPATKKEIGSSILHNADDLRSAVDRSRNAQKIWAGFTLKERIERIISIKSYLTDHLDEIVLSEFIEIVLDIKDPVLLERIGQVIFEMDISKKLHWMLFVSLVSSAMSHTSL